jgi:hypothetical protein
MKETFQGWQARHDPPWSYHVCSAARLLSFSDAGNYKAPSIGYHVFGRPRGRVDGSSTTHPASHTNRKHYLRRLCSPPNLPRPIDKQLLYTAEEKIVYCIDALDVQESQEIEQAIAEHAKRR